MARAVVLTGASGFVGRALLGELIAAGYVVHAVARRRGAPQKGVIWHQADVLSAPARAQIAALAPQMVHCAWGIEHGQFWTSPANALWHSASADLAQAFWQAGGRDFLGLGTCAEYESTCDLPWNEARPIAPATPYGAAKAGLHSDLQRMVQGHAGRRLIWARLFHLFGPGEDRRRFVPSVIDALRAGGPAVVKAALLQRDFASSGYAARAVVALLGNPACTGAYDIGAGRGHSLGEIAQMLARAVNPAAPLELSHTPAPSDPARMVPELAKLRAATGLAIEDTQAALAALVSQTDPPMPFVADGQRRA
jgi:nucleoside-diphosphate-sugar epimerase